ncbi:protein kinase [Sorangium sp. So ce1036]|uniref:serine/threonine protein kinase n=1 Tax=Sorangium sp. So ce1036 TaxID=3133328 RepID=UPI003EFC5992
MELEAGTVVAHRYRILRQLGRGGMGEVFAAENVRTGRQVAIKLLRSDSKAKSSAVERFRREARAAGSINSDHVTEILDVEEDAEHGIVLVFELLEGESLIDRLKRTGPIGFDELHPIIEQVWMGLADAHRAGIIHRDLKPSNVFLERRPDGTTRVKILDFGISKLPKEMGAETLTEMGQSLGTFSFMPPEQIGKAKTVDHRADIYACTTMIYQSMSGQLPYQARNLLVMVEMKQKADARTLAEALDGPVDPRLEAFLAKGLARDPGDRFQSALEGLEAWRALRPASASSHPAAVRSSTVRPSALPVSSAPGHPAGAAGHLHTAAEPPQVPLEDPGQPRGASGYPALPQVPWTGPNGTMVLSNPAGELAPPLAPPVRASQELPDFSADSSSGATSQGPTLVYRPTRPTTGTMPGTGAIHEAPTAADVPAPIEQHPAGRPPARTLRTVVYVLAALLFAVVGFLLMGIALEYLDAQGWPAR